MKHNLRAGLVAGALSAALVTMLPAAPAGASSRSMFRSSGMVATAEWIEFGTLPGIEGNAHVGSLVVDATSQTRAYVYGQVADWSCPEGERPPEAGHGHGFDEGPDPEPETGCTLESVRDIFADPSQVSFRIDKRLSSARLTGALTVSDHGTGSSGNPPVDMTWTGTGPTYSSSESGSYRDGDSTYRYRYSFSGRNAVVDGRIGAMGFSDDADDESRGQLGSYRSSAQERQR